MECGNVLCTERDERCATGTMERCAEPPGTVLMPSKCVPVRLISWNEGLEVTPRLNVRKWLQCGGSVSLALCELAISTGTDIGPPLDRNFIGSDDPFGVGIGGSLNIRV